MSSTNDSFSVLPEYLQRRIDKAFNQSVPSNNTPPADSGGGFVADDGGFIVDSDEPSQIPLSAIPTALQQLDLPPDDEQVLLVFKNAASGWSSSTNRPEEIGAEAGGTEAKLFVSRDDWRSVCAVLLEHHANEYEDSEGGAATDQMPVDSGGEEDEYQAPDAGDSDSDEYVEDGPSTSRRRTRTTRRASSSSSSASSVSTPKKLTARQTKTCLETYALFFPTVSESELPKQRIRIKDIQELSKLIGDKLKGDEIIEMLSEFSTAPDRSMNFADFGTMMVAAKMA
ncbi:hypothetical protein C8F04DRAFT_1036753 [Mycena alexandri]|uniref:Uncharacterized protein n=1 Tax=Mycena alexandri TaxID=1745969 RepID=A0AAD6T2V8_9AGAR|nr:hypothetical protein C8F04DRAFT_1007759 [Mycena alexandri]KAJ7036327.1 hypothetical protein C8F04DRAFT_1036753 [Mycena alexandri]